ncbi:hypothetical protein [Streptomyces sp. NPDC004267]|uniref:hypothetical protein n=1 Tax=Streptomyces sp. NPDC004267 TaxID=3364694 RepID=UPI0036B903A7
MKVQIRHIVDHLVWSTSGTVWAVWSLAPTGSRYMSDRTRDDLHARMASLVRSLPGSARLYGLCARVDPAEVVAQTVEGVDYHRHEAWAEVADAQLRLLAGEDLDEPVEMHRRTLWLAVPLAAEGARAQWSAGIASAWSELSGILGVAPAPVAAQEVDVFQQQAARLEAELGGAVQLRRARPAEIVWIHQHAVARGLDAELLGEAEHSALRGSRLERGVLRSPSHADLGHVRILEGGTAGTAGSAGSGGSGGSGTRGSGRAGRAAGMVGRRWLQVDSEAGTSYQGNLTLHHGVVGSWSSSPSSLSSLSFSLSSSALSRTSGGVGVVMFRCSADRSRACSSTRGSPPLSLGPFIVVVPSCRLSPPWHR